MGKILIYHDKSAHSKEIISELAKHGHDIQQALSLSETLKRIDTEKPEAVILGMEHDDKRICLESLEIIKEKFPLIPVVIRTDNSDSEALIEAVSRGAYDLITVTNPNVEDTDANTIIERAVQKKHLKKNRKKNHSHRALRPELLLHDRRKRIHERSLQSHRTRRRLRCHRTHTRRNRHRQRARRPRHLLT